MLSSNYCGAASDLIHAEEEEAEAMCAIVYTPSIPLHNPHNYSSK